MTLTLVEKKAKGPVVSKVVVPELVCHSCVTEPVLERLVLY